MPSAEHYYQRRPLETLTPSPRMQAIITDLAAYYEVDIRQADVRFSLARPGEAHQWLIANLDGQRIDVARCPVDDETFMVPDIDLLFAVTPKGWETVRVIHTNAAWEAYAQAASAQGQTVEDPEVNFPFNTFADYVAHLIEIEVRLEQVSDAEAAKVRLNLE